MTKPHIKLVKWWRSGLATWSCESWGLDGYKAFGRSPIDSYQRWLNRL